MFLRRCRRNRNGVIHDYWALVESYRTERGPRQRVVSYLSNLSRSECESVKLASWERGWNYQRQLFEEDLRPEPMQLDTNGIRVERVRDFGGPWLALQVMDILRLPQCFEKSMRHGREWVSRHTMAQVLVACRLCSPSSELRIAECIFKNSALEDLLGIPVELVNDDRLYRSLDQILKCKGDVEKHLKERCGELFDLDYDLVLYDITSTYIEGSGARNEQMKLGYSRDHRPDCKQLCIALVVSRDGIPLGYEIFDGNRQDVTTVKLIVEVIEKRYGKADRIWIMDRGMNSDDNMAFLKDGGRRFIIGAPRRELSKFEKELRDGDWQQIRAGLEVKTCNSEDSKNRYILCRSRERAAKERAMHERTEKQIEDGLKQMQEGSQRRKYKRATLERKIGALLSKNTRSKKLYKVETKEREDGGCDIWWEKNIKCADQQRCSEGCYLLQTNIPDWSAEDLWKAYTQLSEAETAFRIHKGDLQLRPIWHQTAKRVQAHVLVCFLALVVWKAFGQMCKRAGLGTEPRQVFDEISQIKMVDVVIPTSDGREVRRRCIAEATESQRILLTMLKLRLPRQLYIVEIYRSVVKTNVDSGHVSA
jgi:transposase